MKKPMIVLLITITLVVVGCSTHIHTVGMGPQTGVTTTSRQYYLLWGLVPLNTVNTEEMAGQDVNGGAIQNYEIHTRVGPVDAVVSFASWVTVAGLVSSRTITVTK